MDPRIRYAVLCGSRTGSTHFCDLLHSTNRLGNPQEYFNPSKIYEYMKAFSCYDHQDYVNKIYWNTKKENDCIGIKIQNDANQQLVLAQGYGYTQIITHWIYLYREDVLKQAISRFKAYQTGKWVIDEHKVNTELFYDRNWISNIIKDIEHQRELDLRFLADKPHIEINYEHDVIESPESTVLSVLDFVGLPLDQLPEIKSHQIKDEAEINTRWYERYKRGE